MPSQNELLFGTIALEMGLITRQQLDECLDLQDARDQILPRLLGNLLMARGYLRPADLPRVIREQADRIRQYSARSPLSTRGDPFGQLLVQLGFINRYQLHECVRLQARLHEEHGLALRLGELMARKGYMTREQVRLALGKQVKDIFQCAACGAQIEVRPAKGARKLSCSRCGKPLAALAPPAANPADERLLDLFFDRTARKPMPEPPREELPVLEPEAEPAAQEDFTALESAPMPVADPLALAPDEVAAARADRTRRVERILLVRRYAAGPRGEIYLAVREDGSGPFLVKRFSAGAIPSARNSRRWVETNRKVAAAREPGTLRIVGMGQEEGRAYIVYEAAALLGLDVLRSRGLLSSRHAWGLAGALLSALAPLHLRGIAHGNLKLANLLVPAGARIEEALVRPGGLRLADFGLPPLRGARGAPEQTDDDPREWDARTDIWAVGAILRALNVSAVGTDGSAEREAIVRRALEAEPGKRFADAAEMLVAVRQCALREMVGVV